MKLVEISLSKDELSEIMKEYGSYIKVTVDIKKEILVLGCELHADGEEILLKKGSKQNNIWGGGIDMHAKIIDVTAVLNLRPRLNNDSMELLDPEKREKFTSTVKKLFQVLWQN